MLSFRAFVDFWGPYFRKLFLGGSKSSNVVHGHAFNIRMQQADAL